MSGVILTCEQLSELIEAIDSAVSMMEPYYSQSGCDREPSQIADYYRRMIPKEVLVIPDMDCPECGKRLKNSDGLCQHLRDKHEYGSYRANLVRAVRSPRTEVRNPVITSSTFAHTRNQEKGHAE